MFHTQKRMKREIHVSDSEKLPFKMKRNLVRLVGERPLVNVFLNGVQVQGLWDTGAMISLMNEDYVQENFPNSEIHPISEFAGSETLLLIKP